MITLEVSPEVIHTEAQLRLDLKRHELADNWHKTIVQTSSSGEVLGWARQAENPSHLVRFFEGKGGFCAVVTDEELIYFALPGSHLILSDTEVQLPGNFISGKPRHLVFEQSHTPTQTATHQAMILGAGLATRFEPISGDTTGLPKPGVPLVGEDSVIIAIVKLLRKHGFTRILVNTFYKPECLKQQLNSVSDVEIVFIDEEQPSGTAGGLAKALEKGLVDIAKPIMIIQGDAITDADLSFLMNTHQSHQAAVTIGGQIVTDNDVHKFGIIETDGTGEDTQSGQVTSFKEKPSLAEAGNSRFANAGFYILAPEVYGLFSEIYQRLRKNDQLYDYAKDFFPEVLSATQAFQILDHQSKEPMIFWAQAVGGYWSDMGNPTQYLEALRDVYEGVLDIDRSENLQDYYDHGIVYWPGTKTLAQQKTVSLSGNVIVASRQDCTNSSW